MRTYRTPYLSPYLALLSTVPRNPIVTFPSASPLTSPWSPSAPTAQPTSLILPQALHHVVGRTITPQFLISFPSPSSLNTQGTRYFSLLSTAPALP
ncbi:uncharacterized protein BDZ83DRAFT_217948 [Colletotrichum acutatum]|uniref:Uncharacterized protein n=1 Tax=Glomerella acutata TaxID=27357 RepID=A0AAD8XI26_GLOAC|nr:uncharacterized protein BDZ83DRAFT_217948 [Colletotrichum acutatum]KAK1727156.1 hypothetical protein BDZ83DRAFT_217948 [Colletotrichum acutatum]